MCLQVRSLTLDVKVWEPTVMGLFQVLGNSFANTVWEGASGRPRPAGGPATLDAAAPRPSGGGGGDDWVWGADSGDEDGEGEGSVALTAAAAVDSAAQWRPGPGSSVQDKERYIAAKYVDRRWVRPPPGAAHDPRLLQDALWEAVSAGGVR